MGGEGERYSHASASRLSWRSQEAAASQWRSRAHNLQIASDDDVPAEEGGPGGWGEGIREEPDGGRARTQGAGD